jgi:hypothetical protein
MEHGTISILLLKIFRVLWVFISALTVVAGVVILAMGIEVLSVPYPGMPEWRNYHLIFGLSATGFHLGCLMVAAGLTSLWFQRRRMA